MNPNDPLLTAPTEGWGVRRPEPGEDPLRIGLESVVDYLDMTAMSWPARDAEGRLVPPPDEHVLDHLSRSHALVDDDESNSRPAGPYTVECVSGLPECELCRGADARYYGHFVNQEAGPGRRLCAACYVDRCSGRLGSATGDLYLMTYDEVPQAVRDICDAITTRQARPSLWN